MAAGREALRARFGQYIDERRSIVVAFSLGAILVARQLTQAPAPFTRAALIEGGFEAWSAARARQFAEAGGERLLFACAQGGCAARTRRLVPLFERAGVQCRAVSAIGAGHTYDGAVAERVAENWEWLVGE
jgi:predicted esterase